MYLGIDVGGTHTDAVVVDGQGIRAAAKIGTDHHNLLRSIRAAMKEVLSDVDPDQIHKVNLSTTLSTNSIVEGRTEDVGLLVSAGPGRDPADFQVGGHYHVLDGSIDHRGREVSKPDPSQLEASVRQCREAGLKVYAAVTKFSTRNPDHENHFRDALSSQADFITTGHNLSGTLNFPRRIATAYFNSAVWRIYNDFAWAVEESVREFGLKADIHVLKADGGTIPLAASVDLPVETILSGPAASIMGIIALCRIEEDSIILDVGGTTTDIGVFADGAPVLEPDGMTLGSYPTLVRALNVRSIGVGGDSALHFNMGRVNVGPDRQGPALAACETDYQSGRPCVPTLIDALNVLGITQYGDTEASHSGLKQLAESWNVPAEDIARQALDFAVDRIRAAAADMVFDINEKPVYTVYEVLKGKRIIPQKVYLMGGPAQALAEPLSRAMDLEVVVPEHYAYANAVGAALTMTTMDLVLFADTQRGELFVPQLNIRSSVDRGYTLPRAEEDAKRYMTEYLERMGVDEERWPEITESESFQIIEGFGTAGRIIRVKCQIRPKVAFPL